MELPLLQLRTYELLQLLGPGKLELWKSGIVGQLQTLTFIAKPLSRWIRGREYHTFVYMPLYLHNVLSSQHKWPLTTKSRMASKDSGKRIHQPGLFHILLIFKVIAVILLNNPNLAARGSFLKLMPFVQPVTRRDVLTFESAAQRGGSKSLQRTFRPTD